MSEVKKRRSKFHRPLAQERVPLQLRDDDFAILELFGPSRYEYLTAEMIASILGRPLNGIQHRCRTLWDHEFLNRFFPMYSVGAGGSPKAIYTRGSRGSAVLRDRCGQAFTSLAIDTAVYHPFLQHTLETNWFRSLVHALCRERPDIRLGLEYLDHRFVTRFSAIEMVRRANGQIAERTIRCTVDPDYFFSIMRDGQPPINYFVEIQRASRKTKVSSSLFTRSVQIKFRDYVQLYRQRKLELSSSADHPDARELKNMRVLIVTDMSDREHENLISLARSLDERGKGLRLFWFARLRDFDLSKPKSLIASVWRTPVVGDALMSILS